MKTRKLICPKCGNTKNFRVDARLDYVSTLLTFGEDEAELDTDFPTDVDIMCPVCNECNTELDAVLDAVFEAEYYVMCPSCVHYVDADVAETCPYKKNEYPYCFTWEKEKVELMPDAL